MTNSIDDILANLFAAIENADYGTEGNGQGYDVKVYGVPELKELLENLGLIAPESSVYTLADVHAAVAGFYYNASSNFATLQADILTSIEALIVENSPVIDGGDTAAFTIDENTADVATISASDAQGDMLDYTLSGDDAFLFNIDDDGNLSFIDAPDFEAPADAGGDNVYNVTVTVSDGAQTDSQDVSVTIADVVESTPGVTLVFGDVYSAFGTSTSVSGSAGDDTISFGDRAALASGNITVDGGAGDDTISFGDRAALASGNITVDGGAGDDTISFGTFAAVFLGNITVDGGGGSDSISIGNDAGGSGGQITVDLGFGDGAADELIFLGSVQNATIQNWIAGEDALVDVVNPLDWTGVDTGTDTVFTAAGSQSLTFEGVTGLGVYMDDFLF